MWPLPRVCCRFLFSAVRKKREGGRPCAVAFWAALLGFGSVGFEIRLLRNPTAASIRTYSPQNRISNAYIHCGRIANPTERVLASLR